MHAFEILRRICAFASARGWEVEAHTRLHDAASKAAGRLRAGGRASLGFGFARRGALFNAAQSAQFGGRFFLEPHHSSSHPPPHGAHVATRRRSQASSQAHSDVHVLRRGGMPAGVAAMHLSAHRTWAERAGGVEGGRGGGPRLSVRVTTVTTVTGSDPSPQTPKLKRPTHHRVLSCFVSTICAVPQQESRHSYGPVERPQREASGLQTAHTSLPRVTPRC